MSEEIIQKSEMLKGKKALIMGVANHNSIAWGIAKELKSHGAELAFTYLGDSILKRVKPLSEKVGSNILIDCDVSSEDSLDEAFDELKKEWPEFDMVVHAIAYMMPEGGSAVTLSYYGAQKVMPYYNVMGVAKAALEASTRYLAADLGPSHGIRVNSISAGPMRTLAGAVIGGARDTFKHNIDTAPLRRAVSLEELGGTAVYLLSDMAGAVTGENHFVDCGFNVVGMKKVGE